MKINDIYNLAIEKGAAADFRGKEGVAKFLETKKQEYEKLSNEEKQSFDLEALKNPFLDSRVHNIAEDKEIKKVLVGIDIDTSELLLSKQMAGIDLVIAHHPVGKALASLGDVMKAQADAYHYYGVPINVAEQLNHPRISEVARGVSASNRQKAIDAAQILSINFMNIHTPADNLAARFLKELMEKEKPEKLADIMNLLKKIPEYQEAINLGVGPKIVSGKPENRCGRIALTEIGGGAQGSPKILEKMSQAGIGTLLAMHASEDFKKEAEAAYVNLIIVGHISSDSLGMNLFLDELEKQGIEIVTCSGLTRFSRISK